MNTDNINEFTITDVYNQWYAANGDEGVFQALSKHWCGEEYTGS